MFRQVILRVGLGTLLCKGWKALAQEGQFPFLQVPSIAAHSLI